MKFRKKPVVIEAKQWTGDNADDIVNWVQGGWNRPTPFAHDDGEGIWIKQKVVDPDATPLMCVYFLVIPTMEGDHDAAPGDWIIKGIKGEFYPCKPDIFAATYEAVDGQA